MKSARKKVVKGWCVMRKFASGKIYGPSDRLFDTKKAALKFIPKILHDKYLVIRCTITYSL